ncbi:hypothetical protein BC936DRAFT_138534 [Jimgerdemannia flammicorona]|uniref:Uncharacterized protein n=1 Tax=Jimgerdemannia flammicorona TaxID=994334 RepID=A0A433DIH2_9FUNG|nr:hypothetical protein BC936DRAFT_138534 [Jimgerdemannia flammicorona]
MCEECKKQLMSTTTITSSTFSTTLQISLVISPISYNTHHTSLTSGTLPIFGAYLTTKVLLTSTSKCSAELQGPADLQGLTNFQGPTNLQGAAELQGPADLQGPAELHRSPRSH